MVCIRPLSLPPRRACRAALRHAASISMPPSASPQPTSPTAALPPTLYAVEPKRRLDGVLVPKQHRQTRVQSPAHAAQPTPDLCVQAGRQVGMQTDRQAGRWAGSQMNSQVGRWAREQAARTMASQATRQGRCEQCVSTANSGTCSVVILSRLITLPSGATTVIGSSRDEAALSLAKCTTPAPQSFSSA